MSTTAISRSPSPLVRYGRAWGAVTQLVLDLVLAFLYIVVVAIAVVGVALTPAAGIGLVVIALAAITAFGIAYFERARLASFLGVDVDTPPPPADSRSFWRRYVFNGRPWKSLLYLFLISIWGMLAGTVVLIAISVALAAALLPTYGWALPGDVVHLPWGAELSGESLWWLTLSGWVALMVVIPLISALLARVDVGLVRFLLGAGQSEQVDQLTHRVATLTETRERTVDSVELERRRIERDLHDGPQQRLVAIAMDLGMARTKLDTDPVAAQSLIDKAHSAAKEAITEMRQVARGIHPPVLTDRGLDAALSALAARSPVPVSVEVTLPERPSPTLEAIAYFCVSEALTNVAKHARASTAGVRVWQDRNSLVLTVSDNGAGGAVIGGGTGLIGLRNRAAAVDGRLHVDSPPGGPTVLTVWLPWAPGRPQANPATGVSSSPVPPSPTQQPTEQPTQQIDRSVQ
ncbi:MAG TPA: histidine kinase [Actinomycetales bacterium]|nr:histidine kinase [Actinomycetales bacterium]